jgi:hypothetical protein
MVLLRRMQKELNLPSGSHATLIYLEKHSSNSELSYLQHKRILASQAGSISHPALKSLETLEPLYISKLDINVQNLKDYVAESELKFDVIIKAPSSGCDAARYFAAIKDHLSVPDISDCFTKTEGFRAAGKGISAQDVFNAIKYAAECDENVYRYPLIVDDILQSGNTVDAMLRRLKIAGMHIEAPVIAFPLLVDKSAQIKILTNL